MVGQLKSSPITFIFVMRTHTAPSSSPTGLSITMITSISFYLSWSDPPLADRNGLIRQYLINITEIDTSNVFSYSTMTTEFNAEFFHPYYYYSCSVSAVTIVPGPYTHSVILQTRIDGIYTLYNTT